jgi:hypothetical protein
MKMMMNRVLGIAVASSLVTFTALAFAGDKNSYPVYISTSSSYAGGQIGSARASSDSAQYIGCSSYGSYGSCYAEDASYNWGGCQWSTAAQAAAVSSITPMSYVGFTWDSSGNCTSLYVETYSYFLPPVP